MKGIVLAGGSGTRLAPLTLATSKQLLPIYDKPMVYYPVSALLLAGVRDILLISTPRDAPLYEQLLGDGSKWGVSIRYKVQDHPRGLADAFILGAEFNGDDPCVLVLGDNVFYGDGFEEALSRAAGHTAGARVFAYHVEDPENYGVVEFDQGGKALSIEEKPTEPRSNWAVTGLYFYGPEVCEIARSVKPSARGEIEISSINAEYLRRGELIVERLSDTTWLDTGTHENMFLAATKVRDAEMTLGAKVACPEEIAFRHGYITVDQLGDLARGLKNTAYGRYLAELAQKRLQN